MERIRVALTKLCRIRRDQIRIRLYTQISRQSCNIINKDSLATWQDIQFRGVSLETQIFLENSLLELCKDSKVTQFSSNIRFILNN